MPEPTRDELENDDRDGFIGRCISQREHEGNENREQNVAICYDIWRRAKDKYEEEKEK